MKEYFSSEKWFVNRNAYVFSDAIGETDNLENAMDLCQNEEECFAIIKMRKKNLVIFKLVEKSSNSTIYQSSNNEIVWSKNIT